LGFFTLILLSLPFQKKNDNQHPEYGQKDHLVREEINSCSCESAPLRITCSVSNQHGCVEGSNDSYRSSVLAYPDEVSPPSC
jgi:hypothetical protein